MNKYCKFIYKVLYCLFGEYKEVPNEALLSISENAGICL